MKPSPRVETGPVQFDDDWRGVFIRGDDALAYRPALLRMIAQTARPTDYAALESLAELLGRATHQVADPGLQRIWRRPAPKRATDEKGGA
jgi:hypothetical protein